MPGTKIEAWRSKRGPAQCHRCQAFRHSSHGCHRRVACVKCGEEHFARDCPRPHEEAATCAYYGGPHPANHSSCPQMKRERRNKKAGTIALTSASRPKKSTAPLIINMVSAEADATTLMAPANPPTDRVGSSRVVSKKNKKPKSKKSKKDVAHLPSAATSTQLPKPVATSCSVQPPTKQGLVALDTLQDVLFALREGKDPVQSVLSGMMKLLQNV